MEDDLTLNNENSINVKDHDHKRFDDLPRDNNHPLRRATDRILQQARAFVDSLEIVGDGVILVNSDTTVSFISQAAKLILSKISDHIQITSDNKLLIADKKNQEAALKILQKIREAQQSVSISEVIVIDRTNAINRPLIISLCPLSTAGEEPRLMLIFRDPDIEPAPQWQIFTSHFNLSAQEARLSLALADGLSINEYSEMVHVSPHTTRTHLKSIFTKTSTRRQADLVRLIFTFTRL
jgi:DNA-binding CsgD family transcriptional regulator